MGLPDYFGTMLVALGIVFSLTMVLFYLGYKIIDRCTPGNLSEELLGKDEIVESVKHPEFEGADNDVIKRIYGKDPNIALALVVSAMVLGMSIVLGCTVVAVVLH